MCPSGGSVLVRRRCLWWWYCGLWPSHGVAIVTCGSQTSLTSTSPLAVFLSCHATTATVYSPTPDTTPKSCTKKRLKWCQLDETGCNKVQNNSTFLVGIWEILCRLAEGATSEGEKLKDVKIGIRFWHQLAIFFKTGYIDTVAYCSLRIKPIELKHENLLQGILEGCGPCLRCFVRIYVGI